MPHIHEKYDFTICAFIVFDNKVLLVHHPRYDKWLPPGGHVELDEDPEEALLREVKEETGLEITILSERPDALPDTKFIFTPNYIDVHDANSPHKHINLTYFATATHDQHVESDEHNDSKWFNAEELDTQQYHISPSIKFYAAKALEKTQLN